MTTKHAEYQRQADQALQMALNALTDDHRIWWLELAQSWLEMIPHEELKLAQRLPILAATGERPDDVHRSEQADLSARRQS